MGDGLLRALLGANTEVPAVPRFEIKDAQAMGEDLGVLREGESFMTQDPRVFPIAVLVEMWKRLKELER